MAAAPSASRAAFAAEAMLRASVRFATLREILWDYFGPASGRGLRLGDERRKPCITDGRRRSYR